MKERRPRFPAALTIVISLGVILRSEVQASERPIIVCPKEASKLERFAAQEARRYLYLRNHELLDIRDRMTDSVAIIVARKELLTEGALKPDPVIEESLGPIGPQAYRLKSVKNSAGGRIVYLVGGDPAATLYAVYRFVEHLGVRFYLHGDVIPDRRIPLSLPDLDETASPLFEIRGIQPFHDSPEGPDWWNKKDFQAIVSQLPKLRMNFIGLHTYPENKPNAEPSVWIGRPEDIGENGTVQFSYPAIYYNTALNPNWGFSPQKTSEHRCGAAALFDRDDFGSEIMLGLSPRPESSEECNEVFQRTANMFDQAFQLAHELGVKTCIGTETPLVVPKAVAERVGEGTEAIRLLYRGIFERIMKSYRLDYYWFWTPENWTWKDVTAASAEQVIEDIRIAYDAAKQVEARPRVDGCSVHSTTAPFWGGRCPRTWR